MLDWGGRAFNWGAGVDTALWLDRTPPKGSIDGPPKILRRLTPRAPEVTRTQNSAKNENGIFGISASKGFRKAIICHVFGQEKNLIFFQCPELIEPLPPPPPVFGGSIDPPPLPHLETCPSLPEGEGPLGRRPPPSSCCRPLWTPSVHLSPQSSGQLYGHSCTPKNILNEVLVFFAVKGDGLPMHWTLAAFDFKPAEEQVTHTTATAAARASLNKSAPVGGWGLGSQTPPPPGLFLTTQHHLGVPPPPLPPPKEPPPPFLRPHPRKALAVAKRPTAGLLL